MRLRIAGACCGLFLMPLSIVAAENPTDDGVVHGTINIALGNKNGLVVLTDSMVTSTDATGTHQLPNPGQKLFKLDDHTVCSVAGFASASAGSTRVTLSDLNTSTSAIIHEYVRQSAGNSTPIDRYRFQLIVAGYDIDDKPKIGRIVLSMKDNRGSLTSEIEDFKLLNVEEKLVSQLNGMPDVAGQILLHPESKPEDAPIKLYATSLTENGGRSLTLEQMVELAKRLAYYTSKARAEVGGPNQVAIFKQSQTVSIDQPTFTEPPRPLFRFSLVVNSHFSYSSVAFAKGSPAVFVRCSWIGMQHDLDGHYYIGSEFTNSVLMYDGGDVSLGETNQVNDSLLLLGRHAILESEIVGRLTATFSSLRVAYAVPRPRPWQVV